MSIDSPLKPSPNGATEVLEKRADFLMKLGTGGVILVIGFMVKTGADTLSTFIETDSSSQISIQALLAVPLTLCLALAVAATIESVHFEDGVPYKALYVVVDLLLIALPLQAIATLAYSTAGNLDGASEGRLVAGAWILAFVFTALIGRSAMTLKSIADKKVYFGRVLPFHLLGMGGSVLAARMPERLVEFELFGLVMVVAYLLLWSGGKTLRVVPVTAGG